MMRKNSSNYEHVDGEEGPDILAMDLNCIVYWSIDEIHDPEKSETLTCNTEEFEKLRVEIVKHALKGKPKSPEHRQKISAALRGRPHPNGHNIGEWSRGRKRSESHKKAISEANMGKSFSSDHRAKLSAAKTGEKNPRYGKRHSSETRERMRQATLKRWSEKPDSFRKRNQSSVEVEQNGREDEM